MYNTSKVKSENTKSSYCTLKTTTIIQNRKKVQKYRVLRRARALSLLAVKRECRTQCLHYADGSHWSHHLNHQSQQFKMSTGSVSLESVSLKINSQSEDKVITVCFSKKRFSKKTLGILLSHDFRQQNFPIFCNLCSLSSCTSRPRTCTHPRAGNPLVTFLSRP